MSGYKSFGVIGAGNMGGYIIDGLLKLKADGIVSSVIVITRSDAKASHPDWISKGAKFAIIDYNSETTWTPAFEGADVLISTISANIIPKQLELAPAAKAAGVKLFLPSEWGVPTHDATKSVFLQKRQVQDKLKELDLPYCRIYTCFWTEFTFKPTFGWDLEKGTVDIGGTGDTPITFTAREDIVQFLLHALINLPPSTLEWGTFNLEGERVSLNKVASQYQEKTGKKLQITRVPLSTLQQNVEKNPRDIVSMLKIIWEQGLGVVGSPIATEVWPEWRPKTVLDVITG